MDNNYNKEVNKLIQNESFISWVKNPNGNNRLFWERWIADHPGKFSAIEEARHFIQSIDFSNDKLPEQEVKNLLSSIHHETTTPHKTYFKLNKIARYAAAIFLGFLTFAGYIYISGFQNEISTKLTEKKSVVLPDGSNVVLNGQSSLHFEKSWTGKDQREVWIDGEAFFDILNAPTSGSSNFIVHTDEFDIEVLGTKFNVFDRANETNVVLESGKIKIINISKENVAEALINEMKPGEQVVCKTNKLIKRKVVNTEVYTSWKDNKVVFDETPIARAIEILENSYGYSVTLVDKTLLEKRINGSFPSDDPNALIMSLGAIFDTSINLKGENEIVIGE